MNYKIDTHVAVPTTKFSNSKYPFVQMKVGDSFLINGAKPANVNSACKAFAAKQEPKWKFYIGKTSEGHRCWRVE